MSETANLASVSAADQTGQAGVTVWINARLATLAEGADGLGAVDKGAIAARDGSIAFAGAEADLPADLRESAAIVDCGGRWITPALVDCHTHLVFGGDRAMEFEMRLAGATYEGARAGGGIVSSVKSTNALSVEGLVAATLPRLDTLLAEGVSTVEIKSGYGLSIRGRTQHAAAPPARWKDGVPSASRPRGLPPMRRRSSIRAATPTTSRTSCSPAWNRRRPKGWSTRSTGFCEGIAFRSRNAQRLRQGRGARHPRQAACRTAFQPRRRDDGSLLWRSVRPTTSNISMWRARERWRQPARSPYCCPALLRRSTRRKSRPCRRCRDAGTRSRIATDCNPGSSPLTSMLLAMNMAATLFR